MKEQKQMAVREELNRINADIIQRRSKAIEASLALDIKIVSDIMASGAKERAENIRKQVKK